MANCRKSRMIRRRKAEKARHAEKVTQREAFRAQRKPPIGLLDLPGEVRNQIYRESLVWSYLEDPYGHPTTLQQPPLTQASKQIRNESLPIFYGENQFSLGADVDQWLQTQCGRDNLYPAIQAFAHSRENGSEKSSLAFVSNLRVKPTWYAYEKWGFLMSTVRLAVRRGDRDRIGDDNLDWTSREAVKAAYLETLGRTPSPIGDHVRCWQSRIGVQSMGSLLWTVAQECPQLTKWVYINDY